MTQITVSSMGPHQYGVQVTEGDITTSHTVIVPESLLDNWGMLEADEEAVVRESFAFLLEKEPVTSILPEFSLSVISRYFPDYDEEMPRRLS